MPVEQNQSFQWKEPESSRFKKAHQVKSHTKKMLTVFFLLLFWLSDHHFNQSISILLSKNTFTVNLNHRTIQSKNHVDVLCRLKILPPSLRQNFQLVNYFLFLRIQSVFEGQSLREHWTDRGALREFPIPAIEKHLSLGHRWALCIIAGVECFEKLHQESVSFLENNYVVCVWHFYHTSLIKT